MNASKYLEASRPMLAVLAAFLLGGVLIIAIGKNPVEIYGKMFGMTLGTDYGVGQVLFRATPLVLTGLAVALPFKAGLFNIGGEGQAVVGTLMCAAIGAALPSSLSPMLAIPIGLMAAMLGGASWASLIALLKTRFGVSEVITSIMLNFIAYALVGYLITYQFGIEGTMRTVEISRGAFMPRLDALTGLFPRSPVNLSLFLALALAAAVYAVVYKTKYGYELRAVGLNLEAARYAGINTNFHMVASLVAAGALAGLVGANYVMGYKHYYESGGVNGVGFLGIAVAMLVNSHPLWILASALLFGLLDYGGLTINADVSKEIFLVVQAAVILFVIASQKAFKQTE